MNHLVSIIIPCYNAENTIRSSISSVLNQSYHNIEIIVINDGSVDESEKIVQNMVLEHKNIILISTENRGVGAARNRGIMEAKGKYIAFLDADDTYANVFIETLVCGIERYACDTAYCRWTRNQFEGDIEYHEEDPYTFLRKQMLKRKYSLNFFNYMYRQDKLLQNNIFFPIDLKYGEDSVFIMEYLAHCSKAVSVDASMYRYCDNENSVMHCVTWRRVVDDMKSGKLREQILANTPIYDEYCTFAFPRSMWALAKDFAAAKEYGLFLRLSQEYDIRKCMKQMMKHRDAENIVKISSAVYCLNKNLFYRLISWRGSQKRYRK